MNALTSHTLRNRPFSGPAAENNVASETQNAPGPAGPGAAQTDCFQVFSNNNIHPESSSLKISKSCGGPNYESGLWFGNGAHFCNSCVYDFANRVGKFEISIVCHLASKRNTFWLGPESSEFIKASKHKKTVFRKRSLITCNFNNFNFTILYMYHCGEQFR